MLEVTNDAKILLTELMEEVVEVHRLDFEALWMVPAGGTGGAYRLQPDLRRHGDETYRRDGRIMLLVGGDLAHELDGGVLDADTGPNVVRHLALNEPTDEAPA